MALTQQERIEVSKKQVLVPIQKQQNIATKAVINAEVIKLLAADSTNKSLMDAITPFIAQYQSELSQYDGNGRVSLTEQMLIDSANKIKQNMFFPNDNTVNIPSLPDNIWKNATPFSKNVAIGKNYNESYSTFVGESAEIAAILNNIATIESLTNSVRSTGEACTPYNGGGIGADTFAPDTVMQNAGNSLISNVLSLQTLINNTISSVPTIHKTTAMQNENITSTSNANTTLGVISTWQAYVDYTTIPSITCILFDSYDVTTLPTNKFRASELTVLKNELNSRASYISTRIGQLSGYLGSITTNSDGTIASTNGWFGDRFRVIEMRVNLITGTLSQALTLQKSAGGQDSINVSLDNQLIVYGGLIKTSGLTASPVGSKLIHMVDASIFLVNDSVYVYAEGKTEFQAVIQSISGNIITLDTAVPKSYSTDNVVRIYKTI